MKHLFKALQAPVRAWCSQNNMQLQSWLQRLLPSAQNFPPLAFEFAHESHSMIENSKQEETDPRSVFDLSILMAAPKSKISPSRKRQKHMRFFPDPVPWAKCDRCGEPKRPHRICSEHADICAMRPEEYEAHKQKEKNSSSSDK